MDKGEASAIERVGLVHASGIWAVRDFKSEVLLG